VPVYRVPDIVFFSHKEHLHGSLSDRTDERVLDGEGVEE